MMSRKGPGSHIKEGRSWNGKIQGDRGNKAMNMDTVRLLKTQDIGYVRTMRQIAMKEVARLEQQVVLTRGLDHLDDDEEQDEGFDDDDDDDDMLGLPSRPKPARKIVFMDDEQEREDALQRVEETEDQGSPEGRDDAKDDEGDLDQAEILRRMRRKLQGSRRRLEVLTQAERELDIQRAKMAKTATSGGETKKGNKIKVRARKR